MSNNENAAPNPQLSESFQAVWELRCKHCQTFWSSRGMEAVVMARPAIRCYSTDLPPLGCDILYPALSESLLKLVSESTGSESRDLTYHARRFDSTPSGPCECHVQDIGCLGWCLAQRLRIRQRGYQHLWTFYQDSVSVTQRSKKNGEPIGWSELPQSSNGPVSADLRSSTTQQTSRATNDDLRVTNPYIRREVITSDVHGGVVGTRLVPVDIETTRATLLERIAELHPDLRVPFPALRENNASTQERIIEGTENIMAHILRARRNSSINRERSNAISTHNSETSSRDRERMPPNPLHLVGPAWISQLNASFINRPCSTDQLSSSSASSEATDSEIQSLERTQLQPYVFGGFDDKTGYRVMQSRKFFDSQATLNGIPQAEMNDKFGVKNFDKFSTESYEEMDCRIRKMKIIETHAEKRHHAEKVLSSPRSTRAARMEAARVLAKIREQETVVTKMKPGEFKSLPCLNAFIPEEDSLCSGLHNNLSGKFGSVLEKSASSNDLSAASTNTEVTKTIKLACERNLLKNKKSTYLHSGVYTERELGSNQFKRPTSKGMKGVERMAGKRQYDTETNSSESEYESLDKEYTINLDGTAVSFGFRHLTLAAKLFIVLENNTTRNTKIRKDELKEIGEKVFIKNLFSIAMDIKNREKGLNAENKNLGAGVETFSAQKVDTEYFEKITSLDPAVECTTLYDCGKIIQLSDIHPNTGGLTGTTKVSKNSTPHNHIDFELLTRYSLFKNRYLKRNGVSKTHTISKSAENHHASLIFDKTSDKIDIKSSAQQKGKTKEVNSVCTKNTESDEAIGASSSGLNTNINTTQTREELSSPKHQDTYVTLMELLTNKSTLLGNLFSSFHDKNLRYFLIKELSRLQGNNHLVQHETCEQGFCGSRKSNDKLCGTVRKSLKKNCRYARDSGSESSGVSFMGGEQTEYSHEIKAANEYDKNISTGTESDGNKDSDSYSYSYSYSYGSSSTGDSIDVYISGTRCDVLNTHPHTGQTDAAGQNNKPAEKNIPHSLQGWLLQSGVERMSKMENAAIFR
ncbi:hypothetical protein AX774_g7441 [Zancudomyces culisetae]|uniref:Uncharacterized protein n=1 Tax=Zancudomyces culisetae TaxID=1213189 RepID=A0A1R1PDT1_ZANCU|nr:hypothetical protein AX774_g7441 [Zancudomyces culisetae]|eukprot:OMH79155.1 hypothetical protein AX774_g7441 [Zancudomyces culisetae]